MCLNCQIIYPVQQMGRSVPTHKSLLIGAHKCGQNPEGEANLVTHKDSIYF